MVHKRPIKKDKGNIFLVLFTCSTWYKLKINDSTKNIVIPKIIEGRHSFRKFKKLRLESRPLWKKKREVIRMNKSTIERIPFEWKLFNSIEILFFFSWVSKIEELLKSMIFHKDNFFYDPIQFNFLTLGSVFFNWG